MKKLVILALTAIASCPLTAMDVNSELGEGDHLNTTMTATAETKIDFENITVMSGDFDSIRILKFPDKSKRERFTSLFQGLFPSISLEFKEIDTKSSKISCIQISETVSMRRGESTEEQVGQYGINRDISGNTIHIIAPTGAEGVDFTNLLKEIWKESNIFGGGKDIIIQNVLVKELSSNEEKPQNIG